MIESLVGGFEAAFTFTNLLFICCGIVLGIIFGVLPGLGSVTALAIMVPITFYMSPVAAIAFLVGINKGGTSGGAIPAILINAPGTPEAAATARDGYPLARQGKPEKAMKMALYSSVFGDFFSDVMLILLAAPFAAIALKFGPPEFTAIILFSFTLIAALAGKSLVKGIIAAALGVFLSTIGLDPVDSTSRMTFNKVELFDGISLNALAIGTLALSSVISQIFDTRRGGDPAAAIVGGDYAEDNKLRPREYWSNWPTLLRSACIGTGVGMLPGLGVSLAAFLGYGAARRASKTPEKFGTGALEGIAATEASNSAVVGANLIPTISLGIPGNVAAALLIGAFMIHGVVPGPLMMVEHGELVYSIFACMLMANLLHLTIGRVGIRIWGLFVRVPKNIILPVVILLCIVGVYIPTNSLFDVGLMFAFGGLGYLMRKSGFSIVCLVIGFLLGPMFEMSLRQTMLMHKTDLSILVTSPISLVFLLLTVYFLWRFGFRTKRH
ncbi:MAG: tripartite tricarboxylate transporter permease [Alphaproteobacteria bacterium]|nr:tripartite tricarboxylate transporter permease [Alphaproteobacteria bacterium]MDP6814557.1 tripartite tricarboxylate transporter permease [Alphaproteobacteria bacterium]